MSESSPNSTAKSITEPTVCGEPAFEVSESNRAISAATTPHTPDPYTQGNIWFIVSLVSLAGLARLVLHRVTVLPNVLKDGSFTSPFPATIYFPALPVLTQVFHETTERLNLTLTIFLVPMAVFPMIWGPLSDRWGRRPCIIASLAILTLTCVGLALVPTNAFWLLMVLRFLQSAGCTGTVALGAGAIADITTRANRGGYFGAFNVGPMVGPCVGPVVGGLLAQYLGWRANVGLCYLANGGGLILGAIGNGRLLDFDYRRARDKLQRAAQDKTINESVLQNRNTFPLESVRLQWAPHFVIMYAACVIGWGWCVEKSVLLVGPLILQVALGFACISIINTIMTLMVDLIPDQSSSVTACVNFMRASLAAILISVQDKAISSVGYGWTYTILGVLCALMLPLVFLEIKIGPICRERRRRSGDTSLVSV
ncbi:uncharacterized protein ARMOST_13478 [Armillaria ostoyae]|uniref:Major facilitator superfamily (MFS) profile domain-containing protein n=1 Tax=Armillaria ostoyae TaxID=47428 RepID=A0A284RMU2_ARMOS|nr:uncharacterized protein ARMOST_13478 [Armillaria ostoyae]